MMIYAERWADQWIDSWNTRNLDVLISLYAEDIEIRAPFAKIYGSGGILKGRTVLREYWEEYMRRMPLVRLEKVSIYTGHLALALHCVDSKGRNGIKTVLFNDRDKAIFESTCLDRVR